MRDLVIGRARGAIGLAEIPSETTLIVIGHGTDRSVSSGDTVYRLADSIRATGKFAAVDCGFLDEDPRIDTVLDRATTEEVILVPFFVAEGWHTATTIPEELGLDGPVTTRRGQRIRYTPPVGTMPEMAEAVIGVASSTAASALNPARRSDGPDMAIGSLHGSQASRPHSPDPSFIGRARAAFLDWASGSEDPGARTFLQVAITRTAPDSFQITHALDAARDRRSLSPIRDRGELLAIVRANASGEYRPLRSRNDLRAGWLLDDLDSTSLCRAIDIIYPGAILHWHRLNTAALEVVPFDRWAARQSGIYENLRELSADAVEAVVRDCCGSCLRTRAWPLTAAEGALLEHVPEAIPAANESKAAGMPNAASTAGQEEPFTSPTVRTGVPPTAAIPCREPCTLFATMAREALRSVASRAGSACGSESPHV